MGQRVHFVKLQQSQLDEMMNREPVKKIDGLYIGDSGTIYFVSEENQKFDFENKIQYNNIEKENEKVSFIEPI